jgi:hypothetical protein
MDMDSFARCSIFGSECSIYEDSDPMVYMCRAMDPNYKFAFIYLNLMTHKD